MGKTCAVTRVVQAVATLAVLSGIAASPAGAQERHKWWLSERVKAEVGLTDQQSQEIEGIFQAVLPDLRVHKDELDRLEREVSRLLGEGEPNEVVAVQAIDRVETARASLNKARTLMLLRMYRVLSPEQRVKLRSFHQRDRERRPQGDAQGPKSRP